MLRDLNDDPPQQVQIVMANGIEHELPLTNDQIARYGRAPRNLQLQERIIPQDINEMLGDNRQVLPLPLPPAGEERHRAQENGELFYQIVIANGNRHGLRLTPLQMQTYRNAGLYRPGERIIPQDINEMLGDNRQVLPEDLELARQAAPSPAPLRSRNFLNGAEALQLWRNNERPYIELLGGYITPEDLEEIGARYRAKAKSMLIDIKDEVNPYLRLARKYREEDEAARLIPRIRRLGRELTTWPQRLMKRIRKITRTNVHAIEMDAQEVQEREEPIVNDPIIGGGDCGNPFFAGRIPRHEHYNEDDQAVHNRRNREDGQPKKETARNWFRDNPVRWLLSIVVASFYVVVEAITWLEDPGFRAEVIAILQEISESLESSVERLASAIWSSVCKGFNFIINALGTGGYADNMQYYWG
jgi:hypothetical protein